MSVYSPMERQGAERKERVLSSQALNLLKRDIRWVHRLLSTVVKVVSLTLLILMTVHYLVL